MTKLTMTNARKMTMRTDMTRRTIMGALRLRGKLPSLEQLVLWESDQKLV